MKRSTGIRAVTLLTVIAILFGGTGCKKKDDYVSKTGVCPLVTATNPADKALKVAVSQSIEVTFNTPMDPATLTNESFILSGSSRIKGSISYSTDRTKLFFKPDSSFVHGTSYTGRVTTLAHDMNGNAMQDDFVWSFTTGSLADTLAPVVIATDPLNGATVVPLNKVISATFDMPMDATSINAASFRVLDGSTPVAGNIVLLGNTASFTPSLNLAPNTIYSCEITTAVKSSMGKKMLVTRTWSFTTGANPAPAPTVISTDPQNNATAVVLNKTINATFNEPMDALTLTGATFLLQEGTNNVAGNVTLNGSTASFDPGADLKSATVYTATIKSTVKNLGGISMALDYTWKFTTASTPTVVPPFVDLKSAGDYGILAGVGISNNAGFSEIHNMDVGISPGVRTSVTGFPPAIIVNGAIYASDDISPPGTAAKLTQAKLDLTAAYQFAEGATTPAPASVSGDQGGLTLAPGIYKSTSTLLIQAGDLTLDAGGDANAFWVFQIASAFTTVGGAGGSVILSGGAQAKNVFWQVGSSATIGDNTAFKGNILALTSITMNSGATAVGRMLCINGAVVLTNTNIIDKP